VELLPDERLGLALVRGHEQRLGLHAVAQRLTLGVEDGLRSAAVELPHGLRIEVLPDPAGQRPREDHVVGPLREVHQLLEQRLELIRRDVRAPFVHLGVARAGGVDDRGRRARLAVDADEVVEDRLRGQLLDDTRAGAAACQARRDYGDAEPLQRPRDVDPLAAGEREPGTRAVALPALEVRDGQRPVDRRVDRDGDDHVNHPAM
jgi:hypothetical protein